MLTLSPDPENILIAEIRTGKRKNLQPVWWHPIIKKELMNSVEDLAYFFSDEDFTDRFELTQDQAENIKHNLINNTVCCDNQIKHFKCKRFITEALYSEIDISDQQNENLEVNFPPFDGDKATYSWCYFVCGGSGSGKTRWCCDRILANLDGPKKDRRKFIYFSAELDMDKTLAPLRDNEKYRDWFTGVDISDKTVTDSQYSTAEEFFNAEVKMRIETAEPGTCVVADDAQDGALGLQEPMRKMIIRLQRVGRHSRVGLMFLLHKIKSGLWTSQAMSSCRYIVLFPRSQKCKIRDFMEKELGMLRRDAKRAVKDFGQRSRAMIIRMHAPQCLISEKLIRLL